jgi:anthranilate synthase component 1
MPKILKMYQIKTKKIIADFHTPLAVYQKLRHSYNKSILLECADYHSSKDSFSIIGIESLDCLIGRKSDKNYVEEIMLFMNNIQTSKNEEFNGIYGYCSYGAVQGMEDIDLTQKDDLPTYEYHFFRFVLVFNHFHNELKIIENIPEAKDSELDSLLFRINVPTPTSFQFSAKNEENSSCTDAEFIKRVEKGIRHCQRGDVFQVVLSRQFEQAYTGDEFQVYRALRSINPSPYLFFMDTGNFTVFGSSPEAQLKISNDKAEIHPIAGTYKRTGDDDEDITNARQLLSDPKENAEHMMLIDLARNDLNRNCSQVVVSKERELQLYSHVIHMVSVVEGNLDQKNSGIKCFADSFPAGTLSGAPKIRAMEIIDKEENVARGLYAGSIGFFGFDGSVNQAIIIRSAIARNNKLVFQAGAGVVVKSNPTDELNEVYHKTNALRTAIKKATKLSAS